MTYWQKKIEKKRKILTDSALTMFFEEQKSRKKMIVWNNPLIVNNVESKQWMNIIKLNSFASGLINPLKLTQIQ